MCDGIIGQDMSPGSNSTKSVGRILTLPTIIIIIIIMRLKYDNQYEYYLMLVATNNIIVTNNTIATSTYNITINIKI